MKRVNLLTLLFAVLIALTPSQASADIGGLTKCSESILLINRPPPSLYSSTTLFLLTIFLMRSQWTVSTWRHDTRI